MSQPAILLLCQGKDIQTTFNACTMLTQSQSPCTIEILTCLIGGQRMSPACEALSTTWKAGDAGLNSAFLSGRFLHMWQNLINWAQNLTI